MLLGLSLSLVLTLQAVQPGPSSHDSAPPFAAPTEEKTKPADVWIVRLTAGLLLVAAAQVGMFWWQLVLLKRTVKDSTKAADAAAESAKIAGESLYFSQRPQLHVRNFRINLSADKPPVIGFDVENTGTTAARDCRLLRTLFGR